MWLYTVFLYFLQTAVHVWDDNLIHHQEHIQTVITTSGTSRTVFATVRWCGGVATGGVATPPCQRTLANTVRSVPDVVITFWMCSWWWVRMSSETHRAVCRKFNKTTGLFISPSGISELDCATTKTDTAERSVSIGRESLQVFFYTRGLGVLPGSTARG